MPTQEFKTLNGYVVKDETARTNAASATELANEAKSSATTATELANEALEKNIELSYDSNTEALTISLN